MTIKYYNTFHCKALQNLAKLGFLVWKYSIWQPWDRRELKNGGLRDRSRVTRLGKVSAKRGIVYFGRFLLNPRSGPHFGQLYSAVKFMYWTWQKLVWATFWAIFSQTHQVALDRSGIASEKVAKISAWEEEGKKSWWMGRTWVEL
jgi:hypothetical protein